MKIDYMKHVLVLSLAMMLNMSSQAKTLLWSIEHPLTNSTSLVYAVGKDGAVALADGPEVSWYNREGIFLTNTTCSTTVSGFGYLTKDEVLAVCGSNTEIFQWEDDGSLKKSTMASPFTLIDSSIEFEYPYILTTSKLNPNLVQVELYDLSNFSAPTIVGDAVIGVFGKNLKVRWKTIMNAKYKVQTSTDLATWADYTDILDGTGSTKVVNIPLDENNDALYARVVRL